MKIIHYSEQDTIMIDNEKARDVSGRVVIDSANGAKKNFMRIFELKKDSYTPRHFHDLEHAVFVYSGNGEVLFNCQWVHVNSGNVIFIPGEEEHQFRNIEKNLFTFVCLVPSDAPKM